MPGAEVPGSGAQPRECLFLSGIADLPDYAARLLRKKHRTGEAVALIAPREVLARVDAQLWAGEPAEFIAHWWAQADVPPGVAEHTRLWLATSADALPKGLALAQVAHAGGEQAHALMRFARIAELIAADPERAREGRTRWRAYEAAGWRMQHHAVGGDRAA